MINNQFPRQRLKIFTFRVKLSDSIFFLLGHSPNVKLFKMKSKFFQAFYVENVI